MRDSSGDRVRAVFIDVIDVVEGFLFSAGFTPRLYASSARTKLSSLSLSLTLIAEGGAELAVLGLVTFRYEVGSCRGLVVDLVDWKGGRASLARKNLAGSSSFLDRLLEPEVLLAADMFGLLPFTTGRI